MGETKIASSLACPPSENSQGTSELHHGPDALRPTPWQSYHLPKVPSWTQPFTAVNPCEHQSHSSNSHL